MTDSDSDSGQSQQLQVVLSKPLRLAISKVGISTSTSTTTSTATTTKTSDSHLKSYKLKAGRMARKKIPVFPRFGQSTTSLLSPSPSSSSSSSSSSPSQQPLQFPPTTHNHHRPSTTHLIPTLAPHWYNTTAHLGDPCTSFSLDHILSCGHKILTFSPEPCARNCHARTVPDWEQPRDVGQGFACVACVVEHLGLRREVRWREYVGELLLMGKGGGVLVERRRGMRDERAWIEEKLGFVGLAWRDEDVEEMRRLCAKGKACIAPWIDPDYQEVVDLALRGARR
ncbi:uncharacterized protein SEPMUDRAFT_110722 [Sphaerulina musiva SO2202]|uniref:Uncharacterized protein n=1 Tax=Sphaerulina musiva (strain SO2202) TaxID=692275 RepID=N1QE76_SPHMS|nr:uncharacterized protein SEPMUDRAFT_110722 [Sphaerulina musiva SO2202]EMF09197.1 hypothetical protein SEPMUDRAFT_110722 [Sphaerulina musiva SO2202]